MRWRSAAAAVATLATLTLVTTALTGCGGGAATAHDTAATPTAASASPVAGATCRDVAYDDDSTAQRLDLRLPATGRAPYPVIIRIHGGGFVSGDKDDSPTAPALQGLRRGYAVVDLNYRLSPEAYFPAAVSDVKTAVRWLRAHADEYSLDGSRIALWGDSAGGNLAALAGTSGDAAALRGANPSYAGRSDEVQAVVDWFGPISFLHTDRDFRTAGLRVPGAEGPNSFLSRYLGASLRTVPRKVEASDPITYLSAADPPILIEHGTGDAVVPYPQSARLAKAYAKTVGRDAVTLHLYDGIGHADSFFHQTSHVDAVLDWLDAHLR